MLSYLLLSPSQKKPYPFWHVVSNIKYISHYSVASRTVFPSRPRNHCTVHLHVSFHRKVCQRCVCWEMALFCLEVAMWSRHGIPPIATLQSRSEWLVVMHSPSSRLMSELHISHLFEMSLHLNTTVVSTPVGS